MADQEENKRLSGMSGGENNSNLPNNTQEMASSGNSLHEFIMEQHTIQMAEEKAKEGEEHSQPDRTNSFFERAIAESNRMNQEVSKSNAKRNQLRSQLGEERMAVWCTEHSDLVLTATEKALVELPKKH